MFKVMAERCDQCLFSDQKIVSDRRRKEVLQTCLRKDCHFVCHKATILGQDACCRGFYDLPQGTNLIRVMERIGCVQFVDVDMKPTDPKTGATGSKEVKDR